ncbi:MAG: SGNH/GDSL hydrolase family protein [Bacteroidales bacterium]|nr:SGNH/GDSL hydrolase family protein [Bacteroidales bacterium]
MDNKSQSTYWKLAAILFIPLVLITIYSIYDKELTVGELTFQKARIGSYFRQSEIRDFYAAPIAEETSVVYDTASQRILFFGDSMLEGLSRRMKQYAAENGHELLNVIWYSSSTLIWSQHEDTLAHFIRTFRPTYIMTCLGGNELFIRDLDRRDAAIKTILGVTGEIPSIWIGPPNWKADTGINELMEKNIGTHRFFPSKRLTFQRGTDGAHPTYASAASWMDSIACWMNDSTLYRIRMKFPTDNTRKKGETVLLSPLK